MPSFEIRMLEEGDRESFGHLLTVVGPDFPIPLSEKVDPVEYAERLLAHGVVFGAEDGTGALVAAVGGYANDLVSKTAVITVVAAAREVRGTGATDAVMSSFERNARREGMRLVALDVHATNERAIGLYRRCGFEVSGEARHSCDVRMESVCLGLTAERPNVLLTSVGRRTYLVEWFKEALAGQGEVHVVNSTELSPAFAAADKATVCPQIYDHDYISFLVDYCEANHIGALVSLFDIDVPVLATHAAELRETGCLPVVASAEVAAACNDKLLSEEWLRSAGIPTTRSFVSLEDALRAVDAGEAALPLIVKPRWGMGSIGVEIAQNRRELEVFYDVVRRRITESYLRFESAADMGSAVLVQPMLDGQEWGMDVIHDLDGKLRGVVARKKLAMRSGETDVAEVVPAPLGVLEVAKKISAKSQHPGNMDVDLFVDADGKASVLEMNARFGGGYPFGHAAGVNLPRALVEWLRGNTGYSECLEPVRYGTYCKDLRVVEMIPASRG